MKYFETVESEGHEQVTFFYDRASGLKAIVAIHDTTLGPALGGTRMWPYKSEDEALTDVLRLSRGMTYKAAAAGLRLGGGKAVIIGDPKKDKSPALFRAFGKCVNTLGGRYITAEDVGTSVEDMEYVFEETRYVTGVDIAHGGSGDPSPFTAYGTLQGIKASVEHKLGKKELKGLKVSIQGLGHVGHHLAGYLKKEGAVVFATDIDEDRCKRAKEESVVDEIVAPDEIYGLDVDVFAPCALGAVVNDQTLDQFRCSIITGAANNQLATLKHGDILQQKGILYAPDYVVNAGGLMNVYIELEGYSEVRARRICNGIFGNVMTVFKISDRDQVAPAIAADRMVEERLETMTRVAPHFNTFPKEKFDRRR